MVASRGTLRIGTWCGQLLKTGEDEGTDAGAFSGAGELADAGKGAGTCAFQCEITYQRVFSVSAPLYWTSSPPIGQGRIRKVSQLQQLFLQKIVTCVYCAKSI